MLTDRELQTMRNDGGFSEEAADEIERLRETVKNLRESAKLAVHYHAAELADMTAGRDEALDEVARLKAARFQFSGTDAAEITRLREQLHLAEVARAAQVDGLAQAAAGWRERSEQLAAEVAVLREALLQCGESGSIFDVRSIVRAVTSRNLCWIRTSGLTPGSAAAVGRPLEPTVRHHRTGLHEQ